MKRDSSLDNIRLVSNFLVVLIHAFAAFQYCARGTLEFKFWMFACNGIGSIAMPALFCMTGYLLFQQFTLASWPAKIMRRVKRLLVPYAVWNLTFVAIYLLLAAFVPRLASRVQSFGLDSLGGILDKTASPMSSPIDVPLWYMRTVFVYALISPVFLFLLARFKGVLAYLLVAAYYVVTSVCGWGDALAFTYPAYSLLAFAIGAHCAFANVSILMIFRARWLWPLAIGGMGVMGMLFLDYWWDYSWWRDVAFSASLPLLFLLSPTIDRAIGLLPEKASAFLQRSSFFLYCGHFLICSMLMHSVAPFLRTMEAGKFTLLAFVFVGVGSALTLLVYYILKRAMGKVLNVWDGTL